MLKRKCGKEGKKADGKEIRYRMLGELLKGSKRNSIKERTRVVREKMNQGLWKKKDYENEEERR